MGLSAFNRMRERQAAMQSPPPAPEPKKEKEKKAPGAKPPAKGRKAPGAKPPAKGRKPPVKKPAKKIPKLKPAIESGEKPDQKVGDPGADAGGLPEAVPQ